MRRRCEALVLDAALLLRTGRPRSAMCSRLAKHTVREYEAGRSRAGPPRLLAVHHYCEQHAEMHARRRKEGVA